MGCPASEFVDILHPMLAFDLNQRAMVKWNFRLAILQKDYCYFQDCVILALPRYAKKNPHLPWRFSTLLQDDDSNYGKVKR